jgi:hypothetical protein
MSLKNFLKNKHFVKNQEYWDKTNDVQFVRAHLATLETELEFWETRRTVEIQVIIIIIWKLNSPKWEYNLCPLFFLRPLLNSCSFVHMYM